jgi:hypothetical protein
MGQGFKRRRLEFQDHSPMVEAFLKKFQAIFTLNQDTLLELRYLDDVFRRSPGIKPLNPNALSVPLNDEMKIAPQQPDDNFNFVIPSTYQPYIKLHGSCNWNDGSSGGRILIMGGQKAIRIKQFPILTWYHEQFSEYLLRPDARSIVIGYSFSDAHINAVIGESVNKGLKLFIIDPLGVDVLDKRQKEPVGRPSRDEYMDKLAPNIIGASRRPLTSIFNDDVVEHARVMKFFV